MNAVVAWLNENIKLRISLSVCGSQITAGDWTLDGSVNSGSPVRRCAVGIQRNEGPSIIFRKLQQIRCDRKISALSIADRVTQIATVTVVYCLCL